VQPAVGLAVTLCQRIPAAATAGPRPGPALPAGWREGRAASLSAWGHERACTAGPTGRRARSWPRTGRVREGAGAEAGRKGRVREMAPGDGAGAGERRRVQRQSKSRPQPPSARRSPAHAQQLPAPSSSPPRLRPAVLSRRAPRAPSALTSPQPGARRHWSWRLRLCPSLRADGGGQARAARPGGM